MKITKDTIINDCIMRYPETAEQMINSGFHCVGCFAAQIETIEMGLKAHGKTDEEIGEFVKKLNNVIENG